MIYHMFGEGEACTLYKDIFEIFQSKQAHLLLITLVSNKEDHWIYIWENATKIPKLPGWNKLKED
jgi:hypothetical protein